MTYKVKEINFHITDFCSGHCPMCYATDENMQRKHGNIENLKCIVHNGIACGNVDRFVLVGGDPCEHPNLVELLKFIKDESDKVNTNTKATIISNTHDYKENGKKVNIKEIAKYIDGMCVTIHGVNAEEHDKFNGCKGSYEYVLNNIREYIKIKDDSQKICVIINLMPQTVNKLREIMLNADKNLMGKVDGFAIQRIAPIGRACGKEKYFIEPEDIDSIMSICEEMKKKYGFFIEFVDAFPLCRVKKQYWNLLPKGGCNWGTDFCAVFSDGTISRCAMSNNKLSANMLSLDTQEKFYDFWDNDKELEMFRKKEHLAEKCKNCVLLEECGGGCVLARKSGDPYKENPPEKGYDYLSINKN